MIMINNYEKKINIIGIKYPVVKLGPLFFALIIFLCGCTGSNQNINNNTENEQSTEEPTRDRTPSAPRTNIPTHTF
jgi:hypothetical protein